MAGRSYPRRVPLSTLLAQEAVQRPGWLRWECCTAGHRKPSPCAAATLEDRTEENDVVFPAVDFRPGGGGEAATSGEAGHLKLIFDGPFYLVRVMLGTKMSLDDCDAAVEQVPV